MDKQVNAQKESLKKYFWGSRKLPQAHVRVCDEIETKKQRKNDVHVKMILIEGGHLAIGCVWKTRAMDINKFQVDDC